VRPSRHLVLSDAPLTSTDGRSCRLVLHTRTGQVYVLDEATARQLAHGVPDVSGAVIDELVAAELLVDDGVDEFTSAVRENSDAVAASSGRRSVVLMPSAYCNMGCGYCGQRHTAGAPGRRHRDDVVARLRQIIASPDTTALSVRWFGGEPMTGYAQILDIATTVIPMCEEKGVPYSSLMVTNGSLLTPANLRRLYLDCHVSRMEITLDGPAAAHDRQRPLHTGRGSFERIVRTIATACADEDLSGLSFTIRTNVSRQNQDTHREFAAAMRAAGLAHPRVRFYTALVRPWGNDVSDYAVPHDAVVEVEKQWLLAYRDHGLNSALLPIERTKHVCVAVNRAAEVIDPGGRVYSCTEQPLVPGREVDAVARLVDLGSPRLRPTGQFDSWHEELQGPTTAHCPSCAIFPICGGSCPLEWSEGRIPCPSLKQTMPMRLTLYGETLGLRPVDHSRGPTSKLG
jgi:uncharacterized protein